MFYELCNSDKVINRFENSWAKINILDYFADFLMKTEYKPSLIAYKKRA